jgi:hypothetical protein
MSVSASFKCTNPLLGRTGERGWEKGWEKGEEAPYLYQTEGSNNFQMCPDYAALAARSNENSIHATDAVNFIS